MKKAIVLVLLLIGCAEGNAQIPSTKEKIQAFIDSIGRSTDRQLTSSAMYPAVTDGTNFEWKMNMWRNKKKQLLWVENIIPDSITTVFFYCQKELIFVAEITHVADAATGKRMPLFRNIFFYQSKIIADSAPGRNNHPLAYYLKGGKEFLKLSED